MRLSFGLELALGAVCLFLSLVKATGTNQNGPPRPGTPGISHILAGNGSTACSQQINLNITIQNNHETPLFFYVTGKDPQASSNFIVLRKQGDCYSWSTKPPFLDSSRTMPYYFVDTTDGNSEFHSEVQVNQSVSFMLPSYADSARLYVSQDKLRFGTNIGGPNESFVEPSPTNNALPEYNITWQFIEFTYGKDNFILNPSYVDFAAMSLDLTLKSGPNKDQVSRVPGLEANALGKICSELEEQTRKDAQNWAQMCLKDDSGNNMRAISPNLYLALHPDDKMSKYYDDYIDEVWSKYRNTTLTINTQDDGSGKKVDQGYKFTCRVMPDTDLLRCDGVEGHQCDDCSFRRPTTAEIMGCVQTADGPFLVNGSSRSLIVPRLCAAFTRSTLLLEDGDLQPNSKITADLYYNSTITNHYSRIIHERLLNHTGYAFAYDDTNPAADHDGDMTSNAGGVIEDSDPRLLMITVR